MVGELQPILNTQISPIPVIPVPDYSSAFAGFFRSVADAQKTPSVADLKYQAELTFGNELKRALAIKDKNPVAAKQIADQAAVDFAGKGGNLNDTQKEIYFRATGVEFDNSAYGSDREAIEAAWLKSMDSAPFREIARAELENNPELGWTKKQLDERALELYKKSLEANLAVETEKQQKALGITSDGKKITESLNADISYLLGYIKAARSDGRVTQEEILAAQEIVQNFISEKYRPFMGEGGNQEVKIAVEQMQKATQLLGKLEFDTTAALTDKLLSAMVDKGATSLQLLIATNLFETEPGREMLIREAFDLKDIVTMVNDVFPNAKPATRSNANEEKESGNGTFGEIILGTEIDTSDTNSTSKAIEFFSSIASENLSAEFFTNKTVRDKFVEGSLNASNIVAAQTDAVLGPKLLSVFGSENFVNNLVNLYKIDEVSAVKVTEAYDAALGSQANKAMVSLDSLKSKRFGSSVYINQNGSLEIDFKVIDDLLNQSGDETVKNNWENIKVLINNEGFEAYLSNPKNVGGRNRDIDALTGTNFREFLKLSNVLKEISKKRFTLDYIKSKQEEALFLYGKNSKEAMMGANTPMQDTRGLPPIPATEAEAQAIAKETRDVLNSTISSYPLPPMEENSSLGRKTQDQQSGVNAVVEPAIQKDLESRGTEENPWQIPWSRETTEDEQMYNELPMGSWFIDPNGVVRKKFKNLSVEGQ
jgi:hypothetical protein